MKSTTGAEATAFSMASFVSVLRSLVKPPYLVKAGVLRRVCKEGAANVSKRFPGRDECHNSFGYLYVYVPVSCSVQRPV